VKRLLAACGALLAACATLPAATPVAPLPASGAAATITLQDRAGPVPERVERRELARVRAEGRGALLERHLGVLAALGEAQLLRGNAVRLLIDGPATFAAMKAAIAAARHRVLVETYIIEDEGVAAEFGALLLRKAAEGVRVALMYDSVGSIGTDEAFFERLRAGGVAVCAYNPVNPLKRPGRWNPVERNHRKMTAVDSDVAFTGGINLSNDYARGSGGSGPGGGVDDVAGWRDTQVELRGPVVAAMARVFHESWLRQQCPGALPPAPPPREPAPGRRVVRLVTADPNVDRLNPTYSALLAGVDAAVESVHVTMAYFAPGPEFVAALVRAARRGVDVALVLPGKSDVTLVMHAARSYYAELLAAGVRIHEMQHAVMHAKTAVVDGVLSTVGSSNLDWRSIVANHEIDVIVLGDDFGAEMEALFRRDLAAARPVDPVAWTRRGLGQRLMEGLGRLLEPLL
jgi:cardiolipin synthase A/B